MAEGKVKYFDKKKGFGQIEMADNTTVFLHKSNIVGGFEPSDGDELTFEIEQAPKGPRAAQAKLVKKNANPPAATPPPKPPPKQDPPKQDKKDSKESSTNGNDLQIIAERYPDEEGFFAVRFMSEKRTDFHLVPLSHIAKLQVYRTDHTRVDLTSNEKLTCNGLLTLKITFEASRERQQVTFRVIRKGHAEKRITLFVQDPRVATVVEPPAPVAVEATEPQPEPMPEYGMWPQI